MANRRINFSRFLGLILIIIYLATTTAVIIVAFNIPFAVLNPPPEKQSYQIVIQLQIGSPYDVLLGFNVSYFGVITVDEPVNITGIAYLQTSNAWNISQIFVDFQDGFHWPKTTHEYGLPVSGGLLLTASNQASPLVLLGTSSFYWDHDGSFSPLVRAIFKNDEVLDWGLQPQASIQVQPKEKIAELRTNYVNLVLTYAILILTALGITSTVINLWTGQRVDG